MKKQKTKLRLEVQASANGQWFFHFVAKNGERMGNGETYTRKSKCKAEALKFIRYLRGDVEYVELDANRMHLSPHNEPHIILGDDDAEATLAIIE